MRKLTAVVLPIVLWIVLPVAVVLAGGATPGQEPTPGPPEVVEETPPAYQSTPGFSPQQRSREALAQLASGQPGQALNTYRAQVLAIDPDNGSARLYPTQAIELQDKLRRLDW